jgi:hypothetical protein
VKKMLGNKSPEEFLRLSPTRRAEILAKSQLAKNKAVIVDESGLDEVLNPEIKDSCILRQVDLVGGGEVGKQICREASRIYYEHNTFLVDSHWLGEFLAECASEGENVRRIIVQVHLQHPYEDEDDEEDYDDGPHQGQQDGMERKPGGMEEGREGKGEDKDFDLNFWEKGKRQLPQAVQDLRELFRLQFAETIQIQLVGGGVPNGSDLRTQQKVQEIARVVKRLMVRFGGFEEGRVRVEKAVHIASIDPPLPAQDITMWWQEPSGAAKRRLREGKASFEELMQIQVSEWTRIIRQKFTMEDMNWVSLL